MLFVAVRCSRAQCIGAVADKVRSCGDPLQTRGLFCHAWARVRHSAALGRRPSRMLRRAVKAVRSKLEEDPDEFDLKEIFMNVKTGLRTIDGKLDLLTARLDQVMQHVDTHESKLDGLENHISDIYDQQSKSKEHQLKMDKLLNVIKAKN
ncbi:hypothetical protein NDU88_001497 [Pleurodeles waltl]|uniref:Uncharacterized protein n=1 Tax=Pleurodeles waltl TaxID=8319 RepID=A0AAV7SZT0_PLEWA|nr:hypothetical protein NDU88_001497 [Pleurodeles waltl]